MDHDPVEIVYQPEGGEPVPAITIARLAAIRGWTTSAAQMAVARSGVQPLPVRLDGRTPLYPRAELLAALDERPGRGRKRATPA